MHARKVLSRGLLLLLLMQSCGAKDKSKHRHATKGEGKPERKGKSSLAKHTILATRDHSSNLRDQMVADRARDIVAAHNFRAPKEGRGRAIVRGQLWRCCPSSWFNTRHEELHTEVFLLRPYKTGATTLQALLWRWAEERKFPIVSHSRDIDAIGGGLESESSRVGASGVYSPGLAAQHAAAASSAAGAGRLYDARLSLPEFEQVASGLALEPHRQGLLRQDDPVFVTVLREPLERAVALFYWAHRRPESIATARRSSPRLWRREVKGSFSEEHLKHCAAFADQGEGLNGVYAIAPQWALFGEDPSSAGAALRRAHVLVGFLDRFDELVVMLRRRLGWQSMRDALYLSTNYYRHPGPSDWPRAALEALNASEPVAGDHAFIGEYAAKLYEEQTRTFGVERLRQESESLDSVLDDVRGHCDPRDLEHRGQREFLPACRHHCEGMAKVSACFGKRFDEQHSAAAVRFRAMKIREIAGLAAAPHTPLVVR